MEIKKTLLYLKKYWAQISLSVILLIIIILNFKPGFFILGNDNFSPEINPGLTLKRSLLSPAWRAWRTLGLANDSEQADLLRTSIFWLLNKMLPSWLISQTYLFFTLFIACFSIANLASLLIKKYFDKKQAQTAFFISGILYISSLLAFWIYYHPVQLFIAAFSFLPLVLWRLGEFFENRSRKNTFLLLISSLLLSTSALTATMFLICSIVILLFFIIFKPKKGFLYSLILIFITQIYWLMPFTLFIKNNAKALQNSTINRQITGISIENEIKNNTPENSIRYYASWMETKEKGSYSFPYRNWYKKSKTAKILSFLPLIFSIFGALYILIKKRFLLLSLPLTAFTGWFLIKGINPPLGGIYQFLQKSIPFFSQVFRWQSSKLWPFLIIPLSLLGAIGISGIIKLAKNKIISFLILTIFTISNLAFVHPYFKGNLIKEKTFVKIPQSYFNLKNYLEKNDPDSRIYLLPETNTLYFRSYSWGFWGSVFLNYLLPNPLIDKALLVGSYENEQAFNILTNAFYSQNPNLFTKALELYKTPFILIDKNIADNQGNYQYDWQAVQQIIENNKRFTKIWKQNNLTLYKINKESDKNKSQAVSSLHHWTKLNNIMLNLSQNINYYSSPEISGDIYPFALDFEKIDLTDKGLTGSLTYKQKPADFSWQIEQKQINNLPVSYEYLAGSQKIILSPAIPLLSINQKQINPQLPKLEYQLTEKPAFITLGQMVIEPEKKTNPVYINTSWQKIKNSGFKIWNADFKTIDLPQIKDYIFEQNSIVELDLQFNLEKDAPAFMCLWSKNKNQCLNKKTKTIFSNGDNQLNFLIPQIVEKNDQIDIQLNFELEPDDIVHIKKLELKLYQNSQMPEINTKTNTDLSPVNISLKTNDKLAFYMPLLYGQNYFDLKPDNNFFSSQEIVFSDKDKSESEIKFLDDKSLFISVKETNAAINPKLENINPQSGLGFIAFKGENINGIPSFINLKNPKTQFPFYKKCLKRQTKQAFFDLITLPQQKNNYTLEFFSTGIGPRTSINKAENLVFQTIPQSWLKIKFEAKENNSEVKNLLGINQGFDPHWISLNKSEPIKINGWEQGWIAEEKNIKPFYWSNLLSWGGYFVIVLIMAKLLRGWQKPSSDGGEQR